MEIIECYNPTCHNPKPEDSAFCSLDCKGIYWEKHKCPTSNTEKKIIRMKVRAEEARIRLEARKIQQDELKLSGNMQPIKNNYE